jgi:hypothetical protein
VSRRAPREQLPLPWDIVPAPPVATEPPSDEWRLGRVKRFIRERVADGLHCPACGQHAKVYRRPIRTGWTYGLAMIATAPIEMLDDHGYLHATRHFNALGKGVDSASGVAIAGDWQLMRHWNLIESGEGRGMWRITDTGLQFLARQIRVPSDVLLYNNQLVGFGPKLIRVDEADGDGFDLDKIMESARVDPLSFGH